MTPRNVSKLALVIAVVGVLAAHVSPTLAQDLESRPSEGIAPVPDPEPGAGVIIYVDPRTGQIVTTPVGPAIQLPQSLRNAFSTSASGLAIARSPVRGGGVLLRLRGRFQSPLIGAIDDQGELKLQHLHVAPDAGAAE
jgi:hypothetical protein